ncbi:MAG: 1-acyl-sn-glycerol-3-phosphate acyltransferase [Crocinitomicaceae bacterium]|nr:1-acyl-sn-glycerol-3-phosphate acyltransferase [Crocinitomicaceae bacterium]MDG1777084.1 1-acyl-sn-glycerol-3-phosphate acyltransferase [Crocinitomicaceae bacterium]
MSNKRNFVRAMKDEKLIDIEKIISSKNPKALKRMPRFLIKYLKRILNQDEINAFIHANKDKKNGDWCQAVVEYMGITVEVKNLENIPKKGKVVLAMNHPLGGMDAMILVSALRGHREDLKFIANDLLLGLESMQEMLVGVNKHGKNKGSTRGKISELFQSEGAVCIFPAGLVSRKEKGEIRDLTWKKTFVSYSKEFNRTIVPIYIEGGLSNFFYRLAKFRKFIGIKANIEMLYLSNELFKQRNKHIKFVVGKPVERSFLMDNKNDHELAKQIKEQLYELQNEF